MTTKKCVQAQVEAICIQREGLEQMVSNGRRMHDEAVSAYFAGLFAVLGRFFIVPPNTPRMNTTKRQAY